MHAMAQMVAQQFLADTAKGFLHRGDLDQYIGAVSALLHHFLQPANLPFDAAQAFQAGGANVGVHAGGLPGGRGFVGCRH